MQKKLPSIHTGTLVLALTVCTAVLMAVSGHLDGSWLAIVGAGGMLAIYGIARLRMLDRARHWERVPAKVLSRDVAEVWIAGYQRFRPLLAIEVRIAGEMVRSTRFSLDDEDYEGERPDVENALRPFVPGMEIEAFIDPARGRLPVACIEVPTMRREHFRNCILAGSALVVIALAAGGYLAL